MIHAAIVGLGRWGRNLVDSVQGRSDKIRFVTGVLRHPENAREYAEQQGLALESDYAKVLADPSIDAIVLATPHTVHAEQILAAVRAGKPVFTEKPFTLTSADASAAVREAARRKVTVGVGFNWRFQPALQEIRRMLDDGRLGRLLHIEGNFCGPSVYRFPEAHWRQQREEGPAGGMTGRGVHVLDAMLYLAGPVDTVRAQSYRLALDYGIDDTTSMLFRFREGATGYLGTIIATAETWRMQVFGSRGWVEVGDVEHLTTWQMRVCFVDPDDLHTHHRPEVITFPETSTERAELENFADAVREGRPLAVAGGDEEHGVAVLEAILESARRGDAVRIGARRASGRKTTAAKRRGAPPVRQRRATPAKARASTPAKRALAASAKRGAAGATRRAPAAKQQSTQAARGAKKTAAAAARETRRGGAAKAPGATRRTSTARKASTARSTSTTRKTSATRKTSTARNASARMARSAAGKGTARTR
jgi:predicted dehydrogenase